MTTTTRSGIPTTYRGTNFRSRLEARWAAFFDLVDWSWTYEPIDTSGYIPDFLIHGARPLFIEVGPCIVESDFEEKARKAELSASELRHDLLVVGVGPIADLMPTGLSGLFGGLMGEFAPVDEWSGKAETFDWAPGSWRQCDACGAFSVMHTVGRYHTRPCGDGHEPWYDFDHMADYVLARWAEAGNATQWQPLIRS